MQNQFSFLIVKKPTGKNSLSLILRESSGKTNEIPLQKLAEISQPAWWDKRPCEPLRGEAKTNESTF
jgi:hypothetical protein